MTIMHNPPHPGEFIKDTYIEPLDISLRMAALKLNVCASTFSRLIKGEADLSPEMALRLSKAFGRTPESWMQMQSNYDLWKAREIVNLEMVSIIYERKTKPLSINRSVSKQKVARVSSYPKIKRGELSGTASPQKKPTKNLDKHIKN
ncbi:HigA family addiction module antitoxin [Legionella saoudiensis]|uniref:HigA family addiction module antitoxin n=1 Tax=Legionella saoudiensis TaxID=1750561 RepID=UPI00098F232A|nr:HigA family addiction module antitoxin [Legionella saoudiensis]